MKKNIELNIKNKELRKLINGLHQIQNLAFYGYNKELDNQELIDMKARELIEFLNSKIIVDSLEEDKIKEDKFIEEAIYYNK